MEHYNYGIELEFLVRDAKNKAIIIANSVTYNVDGNPIIGEVRTKVCDSIVDCVFDIEKQLFLENNNIHLKNPQAIIDYKSGIANITNGLYKEVRNQYDTSKDRLCELSIYGKSTGKILPRLTIKTSLQLNISKDHNIHGSKGKVIGHTQELFDYVTIIKKLDKAFKNEIKAANRVPGVYAIKGGVNGTRIEYRSLPSSIDKYKLIEVINKIESEQN